MNKTPAAIWALVGAVVGITVDRALVRTAPPHTSTSPSEHVSEQTSQAAGTLDVVVPPAARSVVPSAQQVVAAPHGALDTPTQPASPPPSQPLAAQTETVNDPARPKELPIAPAVSARKLETLRDKDQIEFFLKEVRQANLFETVRRARPLTSLQGPIVDLEGKFSGEIYLPAKAEMLGMVMEGRFREGDRQVRGKTLVALSRNGKVFSRHTGNGAVSPTITSISEGGGLLVQASPTSYLQLYYLQNENAFVGNYYEQAKAGEFHPTGTVRLNRE